jgi:pyruvate/2-oxoglutarate dehydrogenase complex dihydrolipoamide dehydrogenase (E3) component
MSASAQSSGVDLGSGREFDAIVLGAGPVGQNVAARTRAAGLSVAVVERELVGGECSYWGCIPSKSLLRPVMAVADVRRIEGAREAIGGPIATAGVFGRRDRYVTNLGRQRPGRIHRGTGCRFPTISEVWLRLMEANRDTPDLPARSEESLVGTR